jgi:transcriptional regulator with XRE-family HTH domain
MKNNNPNIENILSSQGIHGFFSRLAIAIHSKPLDTLAKESDISRNTLYQYLNASSFPDIPRLASIAKETNYTMKWLLFGEKITHNVDLNFHLYFFHIEDDAMKPTINNLQSVLFEPMKHQVSDQTLADGLYIISINENHAVRRIQWQDNDECYLVFGDNPKYTPQLIKSLHVIGKVISMITPI